MADAFTYQILGESELFTFDYSLVLQQGETLTTATANVIVMNGSDSNPTAILVGTPVISGTKVSQRISGGVSETTYRLEITASTNNGNVYVAVGDLPVYAANLV